MPIKAGHVLSSPAVAGQREQVIDEAGGFGLAQGPKRFRAPLLSQCFKLMVSEALFLCQLVDEIPLPWGAVPLLGMVSISVGRTLEFLAAVLRQETDLLDGGIDRLLQQLVEPGTLGLQRAGRR